MSSKRERIALGNRNNSIRTIFSCVRYAFDAAILHITTKIRLTREGIVWYPVTSLVLPFFARLSGKSFPKIYYPLLSYLWEYVRQTDDYIDNALILPSWSKIKKAVASTRVRLLQGITRSDIAPSKKRAILSELEDLGKRAYLVIEKQSKWHGAVSFAKAFEYRRNSSLLLMRKIARMGNILVDTDLKRRLKVEDAFEAIGVAGLQFPDDLMDVEEDKPSQGNLIHAALFDFGETEAFFRALKNSTDGTNMFKILAATAPKTANLVIQKTDEALARIEEISPAVEAPIRFVTRFLYNHISVSQKNSGFLNKFFNETHGKRSNLRG